MRKNDDFDMDLRKNMQAQINLCQTNPTFNAPTGKDLKVKRPMSYRLVWLAARRQHPIQLND